MGGKKAGGGEVDGRKGSRRAERRLMGGKEAEADGRKGR